MALIVSNLIYGPFMCIAEALHIPVVTFDLQVNHPTSDFPLFTMEVGKVPKFLNRSLYAIKALVYPKTIKPKFDMIREICELPLDTYTDGSRLKDTSTDEGKRLHAWAEENVFEIESCPHDWLFPQCSAVVHHGGAGTLAAGIRAGCPTIVCATQGDQPLFFEKISNQRKCT